MERVLVVDDEKDCRYLLSELIASKGLHPETAENGGAALRRIQQEPDAYSLVYSDLQMPELGGLELIQSVSGLNPTIVPVLLTGSGDVTNAVAAMRAGAFDFLTKPFTLGELEISLARAMERRKMLLQHEQDRIRLQYLLDESKTEKERIILQHEEEVRKMFVSSVRAHARSIEAKDAYTAGHCDRVERYAELLVRQHGGFDEKWIFNLRVASILHDIGKIGVRKAILCKPGALDNDESEEMRAHPAIGGRIVRTLYGLNIEPAVRHHHERFDGTGYPNRLKGQTIPLQSRMILIADTFDAMTSDRPYRRAMSTSDALDELKLKAGTQFDPALVEVAISARTQFENARLEMTGRRRRDYFAI
jgi:response regulator RpfG family c-di-GMP phosphodiesterase